ncbi:MAG: hypothetical protein ACREMF_02680 [Gemmatimonadales bacterium]
MRPIAIPAFRRRRQNLEVALLERAPSGAPDHDLADGTLVDAEREL